VSAKKQWKLLHRRVWTDAAYSDAKLTIHQKFIESITQAGNENKFA
jgi:hypothetical protein